MAGFRKIVAATDFSEAGDEAVRRADELARLYAAELVVMHALPDPALTVPVLPNRVQAWSTGILALQRQVFEALSTRAAMLTSRGPEELRVEIGSGIPYAVILDKAEELEADLVVVGGQGTGRRLGGVAGRVVRHAHCSVMVARPRVAAGEVLLATDFSNPSQPALEVAADYARRAGTRVTALHCLEYEPPHPPGAMPAQELAMVLSKAELAALRDTARERLLETLSQYGIKGTPVVTRGRAAESIAELARTLPAELVCVGTSGWTGLKRMLLGSVAEEVVRTAPCSVLVVRRPEPRSP